MQHREEHNNSMLQKQMMANMQAMTMGQPPQPAQGTQPPTPMKSQPKGKGNPKPVNEALAQDTLQEECLHEDCCKEKLWQDCLG